MKKAAVMIALVSSLLCFSSLPAKAAEFMADFKQFISWEANKQKTGQIFVKGDKYRMEFMQGDTTTEVVIINPEKKAAWLINPAKKTYTELNFREKPWHVSKYEEAEFEVSKEISLGSESVAGYPCEKISYSYDDATLGKTTVCHSEKLAFTLKWENKGQQGTAWFQISKVSDGKFKDTLFMLPKGYNKMATQATDETSDNQQKSVKESEAARVVKEDVKDLASDAKSAAKQEVSDAITDSVREGIKGILGR